MREVVISDIPKSVFIPVIRKREILKAQILSRDTKKGLNIPNGGNDILAVSPLGDTEYISRKDVVSRYYYLNGNRVRLSGWKTSKEYIITRKDTTPSYAFMVPSGYVILLSDRKITSGNYIVCQLDTEQRLDIDMAKALNRNMFRKMFSILPNDIIAKHSRDNKNKGQRLANNGLGNGSSAIHKVNTPKQKVEVKLSNIQNKLDKDTNRGSINKENGNINVSSNSQYKYTTVGRLLNSDRKIIGFIIKDKNGMTKQVSKKEMLTLCNNKLIDNIVVATRESNGTRYLRGNGIRIESLPEQII